MLKFMFSQKFFHFSKQVQVICTNDFATDEDSGIRGGPFFTKLLSSEAEKAAAPNIAAFWSFLKSGLAMTLFVGISLEAQDCALYSPPSPPNSAGRILGGTALCNVWRLFPCTKI